MSLDGHTICEARQGYIIGTWFRTSRSGRRWSAHDLDSRVRQSIVQFGHFFVSFRRRLPVIAHVVLQADESMKQPAESPVSCWQLNNKLGLSRETY